MARPRRGKRRRNRLDWLTDFLITGIAPDLDKAEAEDINPFEIIDLTSKPHLQKPEWEARRESIMRKWSSPGCRPWAWWEFDAPRWTDHGGREWLGRYADPRRHLSGPGVPSFEVVNVHPCQCFGVWNWAGESDNPPTFETQFAYLKRHGLLMPGEDEPIPEPEPIYHVFDWPEVRKSRRYSLTIPNRRRKHD